MGLLSLFHLSVCEASWVVIFTFFMNYVKFFSLFPQIISLPLLSCLSFWDIHNMYAAPTDGFQQVPQALFASFSFSLLFLRLDHFNCTIFKFITSSTCSNLLLDPSSKSLISVILFTSRTSTWLLRNCLLIAILYLVRYLFPRYPLCCGYGLCTDQFVNGGYGHNSLRSYLRLL